MTQHTSAQADEAYASHFIVVDTPKAKDTTLIDPPKFTLEWKDLSFKVNIKNPQTKEIQEKVILKNASGDAKPGELLVIMGPSGAGKSSLLDCISGRNKDVEGTITVNGKPWSKEMKHLTSYVMQDDLFYQTITVREHLTYQAKLRMGKTFTEEQYMQRVDAVLRELGLVKCQNTLIGGPNLRGISGGERKRLSFATEILTNPSILFVDEPTSGLDSFTTEAVILQLRDIARSGRTVIATIHQPSSELFALFDQLYLLADGSPVYHGKASEAVQYFASVGYNCPQFSNPADYFMKQLVIMNKETDHEAVERVGLLKEQWTKHYANLYQPKNDPYAVAEYEYELMHEDSRLMGMSQVFVLASRNVVRNLRDSAALQAGIGQSLFLSIIIGLIYLQVDMTQRGITNISGAFFFIIVNQMFASGNPTFISVPMELPIITREYKGGLYHLISWYFAKNVSELPMQAILPTLFFVPLYFLMGIGHGFDTFYQMLLILMLVDSCAVGVGYMVSCLSRRVDLAPIIGVMTLLPFTLFGGLVINSDDTPAYFVWIQVLSPIKYGFEGFMKIYWSQITTIPCNKTIESCAAQTGDEVLRSFSMVANGRSVLDVAVILIALNVGFRVVGFVGLWLHLRSKK